jgi:lysozyme
MAYSLKVNLDTWLKLSTAQGSQLPDNQRQFLKAGTILPLSGFQLEGTHLKVALGKDNQGRQMFYQGRNTWYVYQPTVEILRDGQAIASSQPASNNGSTNGSAPTISRNSGKGKINDKGLRLLKSFEGLRLDAYSDAVGVWTIGYGTTSGVKPGMRITEAQAEDLLKKDLARFEIAVTEAVKVALNDDQFSALVSFTYNVGGAALLSSTLLRLLNQGDIQGAANQFLRWNQGDGRELPGLTRRRKAERALFLGEDFSVFL